MRPRSLEAKHVGFGSQFHICRSHRTSGKVFNFSLAWLALLCHGTALRRMKRGPSHCRHPCLCAHAQEAEPPPPGTAFIKYRMKSVWSESLLRSPHPSLPRKTVLGALFVFISFLLAARKIRWRQWSVFFCTLKHTSPFKSLAAFLPLKHRKKKKIDPFVFSFQSV